jgi:hypothetical protein
LVILLDDVRFGASSAFGGRVRWVQIDLAEAAEGADHLITPEERLLIAMARQYESSPRTALGRSDRRRWAETLAHRVRHQTDARAAARYDGARPQGRARSAERQESGRWAGL